MADKLNKPAVKKSTKNSTKISKQSCIGDITNPQLQPGENSLIVGKILELYSWPKPVTDEEKAETIVRYFQWCFDNDLRPGVEGMCSALNINRSTLWRWERGEGSSEQLCNTIEKAKQTLAQYQEHLALNGKINPVTSIFLMKNWFGYRDQQEHIITPNQPLGESHSREEIEAAIESDLTEE